MSSLQVARPESVVHFLEDELSVVDGIGDDCRNRGHRVIYSRSPDEGRVILRTLVQPAREARLAIVLDLRYGDPTDPEPGLCFLRELRAGHLFVPADTPVVVYSAAGEPETEGAARALRVTEFFHKGGADPRAIVTSIERALDREVLESKVECEVVALQGEDASRARIRMRGGDGMIAETTIDAAFCPDSALMVGGVFQLATYRRVSESGHPEFVTRTFPVDEDQEERELERVLGWVN